MCRVVSGRSRLGLPPLPSGSVSAVRLFGLLDAVITRLVEQLPKAENCSTYNFKYFKPSKMSQWDRVKKVSVESVCMDLLGGKTNKAICISVPVCSQGGVDLSVCVASLFQVPLRQFGTGPSGLIRIFRGSFVHISM